MRTHTLPGSASDLSCSGAKTGYNSQSFAKWIPSLAVWGIAGTAAGFVYLSNIPKFKTVSSLETGGVL